MKKILFLLLFPIWMMAQTSTGQETEFDYGIKNNSTQTITTPSYLTTTGNDGTQGKIPSAYIAKTADVADSLATKAPLSGSTSYIQNQNVSAQSETNFNISGKGTANSFQLDQVNAPDSYVSTSLNGIGLLNGNYTYVVTYYTLNGETGVAGGSSPYILASNNKINITSIPISSDSRVVGRRIYRNKSTDDDVLKRLVTDIPDNTTISFLDNVADNDLGVFVNRGNTTGGIIYINSNPVIRANSQSLLIGTSTMSADTGYANTLIGSLIAPNATTMHRSTAVGLSSLYSNIVGNRITAIGVHAGQSTNSDGGVYVGYGSGFYETGANKLFIDNDTRTTEANGRTNSLVYGIFDGTPASQLFRINGQVETFNITANGYVNATSFVKSGATAGNILLAGGNDIAQSTFQTALTNPITGVLSANFLSLANGTGTLTTSNIFNDASTDGNFAFTNPSPTIKRITLGNSSFVSGIQSNSGDLQLLYNFDNIGLSIENGNLRIPVTPTTSAGTYDVLTRNTSTGVVEKILSSSIGDMTLASAQTNTGVKTYLDGTLGLRNVANTFTSYFTNTNTASRTYTLQNRNGILADDTDLALKAPIASPTFTGTPTAPTATAGTNTTQIATTAYVQGEVTSNIAQTITSGVTTSAPSQNAVFNALGQKVDLSGSQTITGSKTFSNGTLLLFNTSNTIASAFIVPSATGARNYSFPDQSGTVALTSQIPIQLKDFYADANNVGTGETDLLTYTTVANRLNATGEKIVSTFGGTFNDTTATSQLEAYFGGTLIGDTGALTMSVTGAWVVNISVIRTGATTARAILNISTPGASTSAYTKYTALTGLDFTTTNIIKITGTAAGATGGNNDITATYGNIIWQPAAL